jgi:hypothetical protein
MNGRYLGVAELLGRLDLAGGTVVEHPATLEVRMLGRSKIKTARTVLGHLGLMARLAAARLFGPKPRLPPPPPVGVSTDTPISTPALCSTAGDSAINQVPCATGPTVWRP